MGAKKKTAALKNLDNCFNLKLFYIEDWLNYCSI